MPPGLVPGGGVDRVYCGVGVLPVGPEACHAPDLAPFCAHGRDLPECAEVVGRDVDLRVRVGQIRLDRSVFPGALLELLGRGVVDPWQAARVVARHHVIRVAG